MGKALALVTDWKNGVAVLITLGVAFWLRPLEPVMIVLLLVVCVAVLHALAALARAVRGARTK